MFGSRIETLPKRYNNQIILPDEPDMRNRPKVTEGICVINTKLYMRASTLKRLHK